MTLLLRSLMLMVIVSIVGVQGLLLSPILPDVASSFSITETTAAYAIFAYSAAVAASAFLLARFVDVVGPAWAARSCLILLTGGLVVCALAPTFPILLAGKALNGLAAGVLLPAAYALGGLIAPKGQESAYTGRVITGWSVAMVLGVPFAAYVTELSHWRQAFTIIACLSFLVLVATWVSIPTSLGERRAKPAPVSLQALSWPRVARLLFITFAFMTAFYGVYAFLGTQVRADLSLSAGQAGYFVLAYGLGFGLAFLGDSLIDHWSPGRVMAPAFCAIGLVYLALPTALAGFWPGIAVTFLWGIVNHVGLNLIVTQITNAKPDRKGEALGFYTTTSYIAGMIAVSLMGSLFARFGFAPLSYTAAALMLASVLVWIGRPDKGMLNSQRT